MFDWDNKNLRFAWNMWYDDLEKGVRDLIRDLRNRGINTTCSCHHDMYIECSSSDPTQEIHTIRTVLLERGYKKFSITVYDSFNIDLVENKTFLTIRLPNKKGELVGEGS